MSLREHMLIAHHQQQTCHLSLCSFVPAAASSKTTHRAGAIFSFSISREKTPRIGLSF